MDKLIGYFFYVVIVNKFINDELYVEQNLLNVFFYLGYNFVIYICLKNCSI